MYNDKPVRLSPKSSSKKRSLSKKSKANKSLHKSKSKISM